MCTYKTNSIRLLLSKPKTLLAKLLFTSLVSKTLRRRVLHNKNT